MRNEKGQFVKNGITKNCLICDIPFYTFNSYKNRKYCSRKCYFKIKKIPTNLTFKGRKHSSESLKKMEIAQIGDKHWNWRGGNKCKCDKRLFSLKTKTCRKCYQINGELNPNFVTKLTMEMLFKIYQLMLKI